MEEFLIFLCIAYIVWYFITDKSWDENIKNDPFNKGK